MHPYVSIRHHPTLGLRHQPRPHDDRMHDNSGISACIERTHRNRSISCVPAACTKCRCYCSEMRCYWHVCPRVSHAALSMRAASPADALYRGIVRDAFPRGRLDYCTSCDSSVCISGSRGVPAPRGAAEGERLLFCHECIATQPSPHLASHVLYMLDIT